MTCIDMSANRFHSRFRWYRTAHAHVLTHARVHACTHAVRLGRAHTHHSRCCKAAGNVHAHTAEEQAPWPRPTRHQTRREAHRGGACAARRRRPQGGGRRCLDASTWTLDPATMERRAQVRPLPHLWCVRGVCVCVWGGYVCACVRGCTRAHECMNARACVCSPTNRAMMASSGNPTQPLHSDGAPQSYAP